MLWVIHFVYFSNIGKFNEKKDLKKKFVVSSFESQWTQSISPRGIFMKVSAVTEFHTAQGVPQGKRPSFTLNFSCSNPVFLIRRTLCIFGTHYEQTQEKHGFHSMFAGVWKTPLFSLFSLKFLIGYPA